MNPGMKARVCHDLVDAVVLDESDECVPSRLVDDRNIRLGRSERQRTKSRNPPRPPDHGFHRVPPCGRIRRRLIKWRTRLSDASNCRSRASRTVAGTRTNTGSPAIDKRMPRRPARYPEPPVATQAPARARSETRLPPNERPAKHRSAKPASSTAVVSLPTYVTARRR